MAAKGVISHPTAPVCAGDGAFESQGFPGVSSRCWKYFAALCDAGPLMLSLCYLQSHISDPVYEDGGWSGKCFHFGAKPMFCGTAKKPQMRSPTMLP